MFTYPAEVQRRSRGHGSTHGAELGAGQRVPVAEGRSSTETVLQLGQQRDHRLVAVLAAPLRVTPGGKGESESRRNKIQSGYNQTVKC